MSIYKKLAAIGTQFISKHKLFKIGFNLSPMYRRTTGRLVHVSEDLLKISIKIPISYKNRNYVNSIFGGSMFSAVDPIPMVQLIYLLGDDYVVWDKSAEIFFKRPAKENLFAESTYTLDELEEIRKQVALQNEFEIIKATKLTNRDQSVVYCEVKKTIYVADKVYFREKRKNKKAN